MIPIRDLIGKPYKEHGRGPEFFDCMGLVIEVYKRLGIEIQDVYYEGVSIAEGARIHAAAFLLNRFTQVPTPCEAALVVFLIGGEPDHVGVCIDERRFAHATKEMGVEIMDLNSPMWKRRIEGYYEWHQ